MANGKMLEYNFSARAVIDDPKSKDSRFAFFEGWPVCITYLREIGGKAAKGLWGIERVG